MENFPEGQLTIQNGGARYDALQICESALIPPSAMRIDHEVTPELRKAILELKDKIQPTDGSLYEDPVTLDADEVVTLAEAATIANANFTSAIGLMRATREHFNLPLETDMEIIAKAIDTVELGYGELFLTALRGGSGIKSLLKELDSETDTEAD